MKDPNAPATKKQPEVLYFGCIGQSGHYLFAKVPGTVCGVSQRMDLTPWGNHLDGKLLKDRGLPDDPNGRTEYFTLKGWTAVACWDRSVDSRPGSQSAFIVHAEMSGDELLTYARDQWPEVFERKFFPLKFQTPAELWREFQHSKLLWWVNRSLHLFGWAIVIEDDEAGKFVRAYPKRVEFRGFSERDEEAGFIGLTEHLSKQTPRLLKEVHEQTP